MQTFLPYPDFAQSARCLDDKRLGKQRVEAKQIYLALTQQGYGWQHHPAVRMWRGCEVMLLGYGHTVCCEWRDRGFNDSLRDWFFKEYCSYTFEQQGTGPLWLGNPAFHASHRSNLLRKDPVWYGKFGWTEGPGLAYVWPKSSTATVITFASK